MTTGTPNEGYSRMTLDYADVPETPPAHIWAFKALRNGLLGTKPSPLPTSSFSDEEIDEINLPVAETSPSPSKGGILKTPGTISRRKSVTFNNKASPTTTTTSTTQDAKQSKETPKDKRTSILSRNFPGKYPSPFTPRTRQSTPTPSSPLSFALQATDGDTDIIPVSRSALEMITAHVNLVLENNTRLQQIIKEGQFSQPHNPYSAHPELDSMKKELDHEKLILKQFWDDFEQQHASMAKKEKELSRQYAALSQQMEEQYALQNSTAKIVDDYQETIQQLNKAINEQRNSFQKDLDDLQNKVEEYERKVRGLQNQLDETNDVVRSQRLEIESRDHLVMDTQEKLRRAQKQLHQLRMETLESRVAPTSQVKDGIGEIRPTHRQAMSRRSVSATYSTTSSAGWMKAADPVPDELPSLEKTDKTEVKKTEGLPIVPISNEDEPKILRNALSPRSNNIEEPVPLSKAPGQDALARRAAAAKRLEERQRNRERMGKENSYLTSMAN